jgi:hypothetical protein
MFKRISRFPVFLTMLAVLLTGGWTPQGLQPSVPQSGSPGAALSPSAPSSFITIPIAKAIPKIDGICNEYGEAAVRTFVDDGGPGVNGTVYLMYNGGYLYVCMVGMPGTFDQRFGSLYLDPQGDGASYVFAQQNDYSLRVGIPGTTKTSLHGTGLANGYVADSVVGAFWDGASTADGQLDTVEYRVELGRFKIDQPCQLFGFAVYHHWFSAVGNDYGYPSNKYFDQPRTWQLAQIQDPICTRPTGKIAYVFRGNTPDATSYYNLLTSHGYTVTLVPLSNVAATDFSLFDLILIADDSGDLNQWGSSGMTAAQVAKITAPNKPIIGLGEGGYAFFGQLASFIGWPNGWHGPQVQWNKANTGPAPFFNGIAVDPIPVYSPPVNSVGIYLNAGPLPTSVVPVTLEDPTKDHASLILDGCHLLWGGSGNPYAMVATGQALFLNSVAYMLPFQCPPVTPPPTDCVQITKTAVPAPPAHVAPGDIIEYTLTYTYSNDAVSCRNIELATLIDSVPVDTVFVPGSAGPGVAPGADGSLVWTVNPAAGPQTKKFKVVVSENQCADQRMVNNRAGIIAGSNPPVISNVVSHPVDCPVIGLPNDEPMFAEGEISIHPYPLVAGHPSTIQVRVTNNTATPQLVNVAFQTSPNKFGIGLDFNSFDNRSALIPAHGSAIVQGVYIPIATGHYCIQIVVTGPGLSQPLVTQRNLDVSENLQPGVADPLTFKVRNNSSAAADISLVVDNTCPGWTAVISSPAGGVLVNMAPGEIRNATLTVTPPNPVTFGSACHIDVQAWIGDQMIGGIRKMDVPPVQLPSDVNPPWEEPEISFVPSPPVVGVAGKICVELQNPLSFSRNVTIEYAVADFGAGIPFTPVAIKNFTLPPNSLARYCADWTPATGGTLHRCVLVTLKQAGYQDMRSQRNVDLRRITIAGFPSLDVPFRIGNPDLVTHTLTLTPTLIGIDPFWKPVILTDPGDPPPNVLGPGQMVNLHLMLLPAVQAKAPGATAPDDYRYGDVSQVEVSAYLDGDLVGGVTVELNTNRMYLPDIERR